MQGMRWDAVSRLSWKQATPLLERLAEADDVSGVVDCFGNIVAITGDTMAAAEDARTIARALNGTVEYDRHPDGSITYPEQEPTEAVKLLREFVSMALSSDPQAFQDHLTRVVHFLQERNAL